jgi:hypothetical protein
MNDIAKKQPSMWQTFVKDISPDIHSAEGQNAILMHFCNQGYELVNVCGNFAYFKRLNPEWLELQAENER